MFSQIKAELKKLLEFPAADQIIFNNKIIEASTNNFQAIPPADPKKTIAFVDGGQGEIISASTFSLSLIRVFAQVFQNSQKKEHFIHQFYLLAKAKWQDNDLIYSGQIFTPEQKIIEESDLEISSLDPSIKMGMKRAPLSQITNMARRLAELSLASRIKADYVVVDGLSELTCPQEKKYLTSQLNFLAKTSHLFTAKGNSPAQLLNKISPAGCWYYPLDKQTYLAKLHPQAKHIFRFEGNIFTLPFLAENSKDALFLGYPYGLIIADQFARISHSELNSLKIKFNFKEIQGYLNDTNAHQILDSIS